MRVDSIESLNMHAGEVKQEFYPCPSSAFYFVRATEVDYHRSVCFYSPRSVGT